MAAADPDRSSGPEAQVTGELSPHLGRRAPADPVADTDGRVVLDTLPMPAVAAPARGRLAEVARGSTLNLAGAAFSGAAAVALTVVVTRSFSKPLAGAFFTAISLFLIAETAATLGGYVGLVNFIAGLRSLGQEGRVSAILRAAIVPVTVVSVAMAAAMALAAGPLTRVILGGQLGHAGANEAAAIGALRWLAVALPFAALLDTLLGATRGYRDMRPTVVLDRLGRSGLQLLGVAVAAVMGAASLLAPLWAVPYLPAAVLAWRVGPQLDRALGSFALRPLQEQLLPFPPAQPAVGSRVSRQLGNCSSRVLGRARTCGARRASGRGVPRVRPGGAWGDGSRCAAPV